MNQRQLTALWTLFCMVLTSSLVTMATDSLTLGFAVASAFMTLAGIMELYQ
jgi:hypothetical protein